jgi:hypothetical protein
MSTQVPFIPPAPATGIHRSAAEIPPSATPAGKPKKKLIRRLQKDRSQLYRRGFQVAFLLLNLALGAKFYFWVRQLETRTTSLHRPPLSIDEFIEQVFNHPTLRKPTNTPPTTTGARCQSTNSAKAKPASRGCFF